jgi:ribonuclease III
MDVTNKSPFAELETVLGHTFANRSLLEEALTHSSMRANSTSTYADNQRLEFLGDTVVQLLVSDMIFQRLLNSNEGAMTKLRATLVSTRALSRIARHWGFGKFLRMSRSEADSGGRDRDSLLADLTEAIMGAVYLDGGFETARRVATIVFEPFVSEQERIVPIDDGNPKGQLQETTQFVSSELPIYTIVEDSGPDHEKQFTCTVSWEAQEVGRGIGRTKRAAEAAAARDALEGQPLKKIVGEKRATAPQPAPRAKPRGTPRFAPRSVPRP